MKIQTVNPATDELIKHYTPHTHEQINTIIQNADRAFQQWRNNSYTQRAVFMQRIAKIMRNRVNELSALITQEMGKPITAARSEIEKCASVCDFYAENTIRFLQDELVKTDAHKSFIAFEPLGVVLAVMPWNFPFWQVFRFAAPGLMAGNACLLKHASNVTACALAIEALFQEAEFPDNLFQTLLINANQVSGIIAHPKVRAVTLTGSTGAGKAVAAAAGQALKKVVLELGGSDPYLILEDADIEFAAKACVTSRLINGGQSCVSAKRFIVVEKIKPQFERIFVQEMQNTKIGDPLDENVKIGPLARKDLRDELHTQVLASIDKGSRCLLGGKLPDGKGAYYPPTVLTDVTLDSPAYHEELFGPVAAIISAKNEDDAIRIANDSCFGLGAAVFTQDTARGEQIAKTRLDAGCCFVNDFVRSDPKLPFGGIKESGYGRELSHYGIKEFVNIKTVYIR